ncbi:MAG: Tex-like N-terminal domain-containing protein, partial [Oscillospiraceae bacterium]
MDIQKILMEELSIKDFQVENVIKLIDDGNTIPFIARYRKEQTGSLDDVVLRDFYDRLVYLRSLEARQNEVIGLIDGQGNLTEEIKTSLLNAKTLSEIDDIYRPFRPKRRTRATIAKEKGLEPLADLIFCQDGTVSDFVLEAEKYINEEKEVLSAEDALAGAMDIIAEGI